MSILVNFVFKGQNLVIPLSNGLYTKFNKILHPGEKYTLPSGIEREMTYGYAEISKDVEETDVEDFLDHQLILIRKNLKPLKEIGLEEIILYLTFKYRNQYNWEFEPVFLGKLSELSITLAISAYEEND